MEHARHLIADYLPWLMSAITITAIELQGRKAPKAWALSLAGQLLWFTWIGFTWQHNKGFAPMTIVLSFQYARNHWRWVREAREGGKEPPGSSQERLSRHGLRTPAFSCECCPMRHPVSGACCHVYSRPFRG